MVIRGINWIKVAERVEEGNADHAVRLLSLGSFSVFARSCM